MRHTATLTSLILTVLIMCTTTVVAQNETADKEQGEYNKAYNYFYNGQFEEAEDILLQLVKTSSGLERSSAYRMLALSAIEQGDNEKANRYVAQLLKYDPFFTPSMGDSQKFIDMLERNKYNGATITTASNQSESIDESPVPVTLITEDMIQASGAQTLRDLLCLFVPTMTRVEGMETNICMRGIVGNSQEDILIMLDGHRLNSGATNAEAPDFRNSLHKIKQIEVLRGPASSLYGNVALMAVVNIITKRGYEVDGADISLRGGSYNTWGGDLLYGKGNHHSDILAWGSVYNSIGEKVTQDGTPHFIDGFRESPAYDLGMKGHYGDITMTFTHQHSKPVPYYNQITMSPYTYEDYPEISGNKPGASRSTTSIFADYQHQMNKMALAASVYGSYESTDFYNALGDVMTPPMITTLMKLDGPAAEFMAEAITHTSLLLGWQDFSGGMNINLSADYKLGSQHGNILFGIQADVFKMSSSRIELNYLVKPEYAAELAEDNENMTQIQHGIVGLHSESTYSGYLQLKNYITSNLIFNGGLRFDSKHRFNESINTVSPRVAFIWMPTHTSNIKLSYAHSFVDAPYLYRANQLDLYRGKADLNPQQNDAFQLSGSKTWSKLNLRTELNLYYNSVHDICFFSYNALMRGAPEGPFSTASVDICGAEAIAEYKVPKTFAHLNMSYKYPIKTPGYGIDDHTIGNEPAFMVNVVAGQRLFSTLSAGQLWLRGNVHFQTAAEMEISYLVKPAVEAESHTPAQALFNAGIDWQGNKGWTKHLRLSLDAYNVFNSSYRVGAQLQTWIPAQSTKLIGKLTIML